jgi:hypothetical protein
MNHCLISSSKDIKTAASESMLVILLLIPMVLVLSIVLQVLVRTITNFVYRRKSSLPTILQCLSMRTDCLLNKSQLIKEYTLRLLMISL